jgi:SAM-dependent methyltransferase
VDIEIPVAHRTDAEVPAASVTAPLTHLQRLRRAELDSVLRWFKPHERVLELGAGSGYQASLLAAHGYDVTAIDIATRPRSDSTYFPVQEYDGREIPLPTSSVDVVFSSHVLEHVDPLPPLLAETRRVMRREAVAIHIVPSPSWRIWTSLAHYPFVLKSLVAGTPRDSLVSVASARAATERFGILQALWKAIVHPFRAHGSGRNAPAEVREFSRARWIREFGRNGFEILDASPTNLFYTGYGVFPRMSIPKRQRVSSYLGSASHAFLLRKTGTSE